MNKEALSVVDTFKMALEALDYTTNLARFLLKNEANIGPMLKADKAITAIEAFLAQQSNEQVETVTETMRQMLEVQGQHGNWNYDSYMHGLYNGMEYMVALAEKREPKFRDAPETWLAKYEVKRNNFNSTEPLTEATHPPVPNAKLTAQPNKDKVK